MVGRRVDPCDPRERSPARKERALREGETAEMVRWARVAGVGYLLIIVSGIWAEFMVRGSLVAPGDPASLGAAMERLLEAETSEAAGGFIDVAVDGKSTTDRLIGWIRRKR